MIDIIHLYKSRTEIYRLGNSFIFQEDSLTVSLVPYNAINFKDGN